MKADSTTSATAFSTKLEVLSITLGDLKGAGIHRAKKYLTKVALLDFPKGNTENAWETVRKIYAIRNVVAHADGRIVSRKDEAVRIVEESESLQLGVDGRLIVISDGYLKSVTGSFRSLTFRIGDAIRRSGWDAAPT